MLGAAALWAALFATAAAAQTLPYRRTVAQTVGPGTTCITWAQRSLLYTFDAAGSVKTPGGTELQALDAAFGSWRALSGTCSDFTFTRGADVPNALVGRGTETSNVLVFREARCLDVVPSTDACLATEGACANQYRCWDYSDTTIALTTVTYSSSTGVIRDADVEFNAAPHADGSSFLFTTVSSPPCSQGAEAVTCVAIDVQNTATHELGHVLGFDHVDIPTSTMAPTAPLGEISKRVIDVGTAEGFCATYPRGQPPVPCDELALLRRQVRAESVGSFGYQCGLGGAPVVAAGLAWLWARRRFSAAAAATAIDSGAPARTRPGS